MRDERRLVGPPALDAVANVEDHEAVVPPRCVHEAVLDVDVVQHDAGGDLLRTPVADGLWMSRIGNVDDVQRSRPVIR